uniref:inositol-polyphosphate 5-phosphatase n=1 Tax=Cyanistes caeruleus TaxID=156563 RepID=A0A8C0VDN9_CYACU
MDRSVPEQEGTCWQLVPSVELSLAAAWPSCASVCSEEPRAGPGTCPGPSLLLGGKAPGSPGNAGDGTALSSAFASPFACSAFAFSFRELLSSDAMKDYNRARVYLDENYKSQEHFTALGSFYFLHESLKNIYQFDFKAKKYKKVTGKEIYSDTLESTPMLEKEKFPQDYFPECKWSRKGFIRTRWCITDCAFDLVNIHLFHDASNLIAWETSPSVYSGIRHKALGYVLDRIIDQRFEKVSYFVFGDFNFRLDAKAVVETLCAKATMQTIRAADTNEVVKLIFRESDNDRKVMLQLEKKLFDYFNQDVFRDNNGTALLEFDRELSVFKDRLYELDISFPPSYPYSEDSSQGRQYMNTRCPAWCDRILMSHSAKELILKSENDEKIVIYDHIGPNVCMGDHKPGTAPGSGPGRLRAPGWQS